ncbi:DUF4124 domain-containing protein [Solimonas sp. SE-A11]|uniref:DUF4124 domain-containing protein n=1 Tax=Solimonas sp. SE-A11 TaxID=3054954 RepID=UPI00259CE686|nr:DUF4124 domain-containing protein [Solimonas sp. SE-A11]MDM4771144.1 DUF4124 domain-containing protein [Solimonas sp. SE-A11]
MRRTALALCLLLAPALAGAQAYRWVDAQGQVHYSQTPPAQGQYGQVAPPPPSPGASPHLEAMEAVGQSPTDKAREQRQAASAERQRQQRCEQARRQSAHMQGTGVYYSADQKGDRSYLSPQQIDQRRAEARAAVQEHCD